MPHGRVHKDEAPEGNHAVYPRALRTQSAFTEGGEKGGAACVQLGQNEADGDFQLYTRGRLMPRRPPLDDRELLRLLESGMGPSEAARQMGYPTGTVTGRAKKLRDRGFLLESGAVNWPAFDAWEKSDAGQRAKAQAKRGTPASAPDSATLPKGALEGVPEGAPRREGPPEDHPQGKAGAPNSAPEAHRPFPEEDRLIWEDLKAWWGAIQRLGGVPIGALTGAPGSEVIKKGYSVSRDLDEALRAYAQREGVTLREALDAALRYFLALKGSPPQAGAWIETNKI